MLLLSTIECASERRKLRLGACRFAVVSFVGLLSETVQRCQRAALLAFRRSSQMRFMFIVKSTHAGPPTPELVKAMDTLADREIKAGRLLDHGGLMPLATGAQVRIASGKLSVIDGPFAEAKEVVGGYAIFELPGKEEALAAAKEFMQLHKELMPKWEGVCELRAFASSGA
jgi:hypothetical protein